METILLLFLLLVFLPVWAILSIAYIVMSALSAMISFVGRYVR